MNREQMHRAFQNYDEAFAGTQRQIMSVMKTLDKMYLDDLTSRMMWDCLMGLLVKKGILTQGEFEKELGDLAEATRKSMQEAERVKAEAKELAKGKVTVLSQEPAIPVIT